MQALLPGDEEKGCKQTADLSEEVTSQTETTGE